METVREFIAYLQYEKRYSVNTVQAYQNDLEQFFLFVKSRFGPLSLTEITHTHIRSWLAQLRELNNTARSVNRKISSLKSWFKFLMKNNHLDTNPMGRVVSPKNVKRLPVFVNESFMNTSIDPEFFSDDITGHTRKLVIEILYQTGMRRAEILGLTVNSIDYSNRQIKVLGKGNKERIIPLGPELLVITRQYEALRNAIPDINHDHLLILENGKPLYAKYIYNTVQQYLRMSGTSIDKKSPHVLRHTFATHMLNKGADLNAVKELLGHASLAATQVYTHNTIDKLRDIYKKAHPKA